MLKLISVVYFLWKFCIDCQGWSKEGYSIGSNI